MNEFEGSTSLKEQQLQPSIKGSNSSKYLSEDPTKVNNFSNKVVANDTNQVVLEFKLDKQAYDKLMSDAVDQAGSKGIDAIKINKEGITDPKLRNIGVPPSKLEEFNKGIKNVIQAPKNE